MAHIVVLGAGVIGLQTASFLLDAGYRVTIVAAHIPGDEHAEYTSPWAGAIWRTHATPDQEELCEWDIQGYEYWMGMLDEAEKEGQSVVNGMQRVPIYTYYRNTPNISASSATLWFSKHVQNFTVLPSSSLPSNSTFGISYTTVVINPTIYLQHLYYSVIKKGARVIKKKMSTVDGLHGVIKQLKDTLNGEVISAVVNCTGLAAGAICADETVYPIRGQMLVVSLSSATPSSPPSPHPIYMLDDPSTAPNVTYILPRPSPSPTTTPIFILGGTKTPHSASPIPDPAISEGILQRCKEIWREAVGKEIRVLREQVGLRPGRKGGPRVEVEVLGVGDGTDGADGGDGGDGKGVVRVIHAYGHAGAGYQNSVGCARKVVNLVREIVGAS